MSQVVRGAKGLAARSQKPMAIAGRKNHLLSFVASQVAPNFGRSGELYRVDTTCQGGPRKWLQSGRRNFFKNAM